jgi:hypothetical protein
VRCKQGAVRLCVSFGEGEYRAGCKEFGLSCTVGGRILLPLANCTGGAGGDVFSKGWIEALKGTKAQSLQSAEHKGIPLSGVLRRRGVGR